MTLGNNIKKIRELKNLTQEYVAEQIGVSRRWYMKLENDEESIKDDKLNKICKVLDIDINELKTFDQKKIFNSYFNDNATNQGNVFYIENENLKKEKEHFESQLALYQSLIKEKDLHIESLKKIIKLSEKSK